MRIGCSVHVPILYWLLWTNGSSTRVGEVVLQDIRAGHTTLSQDLFTALAAYPPDFKIFEEAARRAREDRFESIEREDMEASGILFSTPLKAVKELLSGPKPCSPRKNKELLEPKSYTDDTDFRLYKEIPYPVYEFLRSRFRALRLCCSEHKAEKFSAFSRDNNLPELEGFVAPDRKKWNLAAFIDIDMPTDEEKEIFNLLDPGYLARVNNKGEKVVRSHKRGTVLRIVDTMLALTLLVMEYNGTDIVLPQVFRVTSYPRLDRRRGPKKTREELAEVVT